MLHYTKRKSYKIRGGKRTKCRKNKNRRRRRSRRAGTTGYTVSDERTTHTGVPVTANVAKAARAWAARATRTAADKAAEKAAEKERERQQRSPTGEEHEATRLDQSTATTGQRRGRWGYGNRRIHLQVVDDDSPRGTGYAAASALTGPSANRPRANLLLDPLRPAAFRRGGNKKKSRTRYNKYGGRKTRKLY